VEQRAALLPVPDAPMYLEASPLGGGPRGAQGDALYTARNPGVGAVFTWFQRSELRTRRARRLAAEKAAATKGDDVFYPPLDSLRAEDREEPPAVVLTVADEQGHVVRRLTGPTGAGFQRVRWDFRYPAPTPITSLTPPQRGGGEDDGFAGPSGPMAVPGTYTVTLATRQDGRETVVGSQTFKAVPLGQDALSAPDRAAVAAFHQETARLQRAAMGTNAALTEADTRLQLLRRAIDATPGTPALADRARALAEQLRALRTEMDGDNVIAGESEPTPPTLIDRIQRVVQNTWSTVSAPTATHRRNYQIASEELTAFLPRFRAFLDDQKKLEDDAEAAGAPWTPGRVPVWKP
jgi:hypothetical protein